MRVTSRNGLQPLLIRCVTSIDTDTPKQSLVLSVKKGPLHYSLQRSNGNRNRVRVHLYSSETESDIAFRWIHRESNIMFTLSSDKDQIKDSLLSSLSLNVNKP